MTVRAQFGSSVIYGGISGAELVEVSTSCHVNRAEGFSI